MNNHSINPKRGEQKIWPVINIDGLHASNILRYEYKIASQKNAYVCGQQYFFLPGLSRAKVGEGEHFTNGPKRVTGNGLRRIGHICDRNHLN